MNTRTENLFAAIRRLQSDYLSAGYSRQSLASHLRRVRRAYGKRTNRLVKEAYL
jgi:hypothetical protein